MSYRTLNTLRFRRFARRPLGLMILWIAAALAPPAFGAGLLAPTDETLPPLRVTDHLVEAEVHDGIARTRIRQTFHNGTQRRLEATYIFPLPEEGDLTDFQMSFNGKMAQGRVLPADEARRIYESIVRQAKDPGLIEFIGRRLLQMRVFPIEPGSDTTVELRYQQICQPVSGMTAYSYPMRTARSDGHAYGTLRFEVKLQTTAPLKNIWSPTHAVEIVRDGEHAARIAHESSGSSLEEDFLLLYATDSSDVGCSVVSWKPSEKQDGHFVLMLTPRQLWPQEQRPSQNVIFVLDTSGSMAGEKLAQARSALRYCIDQLDESDRFSIVRFSTGFDVLFEPLRAADKGARDEAKQWVDGFSAAGGTNITDTMQRVMTMCPGDDERPCVVIFITDGQGNRKPDEIMAALQKSAPDDAELRLFPFGVGHDVNTVLLDRLASTWTGRSTYVQPGQNLELVLGDFFAIVSRPVLTDLRLTLPEIGATERFPAVLGDLYHGQQITIAGRFDEPATGSVRLEAKRAGEPVAYEWPEVAFTHTKGADDVPAVWAGRKIAWLIDQMRMHGESEEMIAEVLALSQEHGIQTPYSSWLVDPEREEVATRFLFREGGGGGFGGGSRAGGRSVQRRALGRVMDDDSALEAGARWDSPGAPPAAAGVAAAGEIGEAAVDLAVANAALRDRLAVADGGLENDQVLARRIGDRWYHRIGRYLVDRDLDEQTEVTVVRFGSEAYFELARSRADLRPVLATDRLVVVMTADGRAVMVADEEGIETFTEEQRRELELGGPEGG